MRRMCFAPSPPSGVSSLPACSGVSSQHDRHGPVTYANDQTFTLGTGLDDLGTFDPYRNQLIFGLTGLAYDSLVNWQPNGTFASGLAVSWKTDMHGATFTLKSGVTCFGGSPLTASQVATDLKFLANPKNGS